jgi:hypothetical protein
MLLPEALVRFRRPHRLRSACRRFTESLQDGRIPVAVDEEELVYAARRWWHGWSAREPKRVRGKIQVRKLEPTVLIYADLGPDIFSRRLTRAGHPVLLTTSLYEVLNEFISNLAPALHHERPKEEVLEP